MICQIDFDAVTCTSIVKQTAKRGTVSAPCTPGRSHVSEDSACILQRIQRLQTVNVQRELDEQAKSFQNRIDSLRLKSQVRSGDLTFRSKGLMAKTRLSSTSSTTQVVSIESSLVIYASEFILLVGNLRC